MEQGWVYVLKNPTMPGLVKVGRTTRLPSTRVAELSQATGVASPFVLVFEQSFGDCVSAERDIHGVLEQCGMRLAPNREFFRGRVTDIIHLVQQYACDRGDASMVSMARSSSEFLQDGDQHLFGQEELPQDVAQALRCYQLAAAGGSLLAFERLGMITAKAHGATWSARNRAIGFFKSGASQGNYYCYCGMAEVAAEDGNCLHFKKAWDLFFFHRRSAWNAEAEGAPRRYLDALRRYIVTCMALGLRPGHLPELRAEAETLIHDLSSGEGGDINRLALSQITEIALRWTRQTLIPRPFFQAALTLSP